MSSYGYKNMCTVNELLFTKKISQGSQEPHRQKYFSIPTNQPLSYNCNNSMGLYKAF